MGFGKYVLLALLFLTACYQSNHGDGEDQDANAKSRIVKFEADKSSPFALIDLTEAYKKYSKKTLRSVGLVADRRAVLVQDEFQIQKPCELAWGMTTDAAIATKKGGIATLTLKGNELTARILSPAGAEFTVESAEQRPPQKKNAGVSRLMVRLPNAKGNVRLAVLLSPKWRDGGDVKQVQIKPLSDY